MIAADVLEKVLIEHLPRQRWFGGGDGDVAALAISRLETLRREWPALVHVLADITRRSGDVATYQLVIGLRPIDAPEAFFEGKADAILGEVDTEEGSALAYDAVIDPDLALALLEQIAPGTEASRARLIGTEQSNSSVVFDERLIMKVFRRLADGPNPDAEVTRALSEVGFEAVASPIADWHAGGLDLAVVNEFLLGAVDGLHFALTSLRDLYDRRVAPTEAGGDFGPEARRLGIITAHMHLALAQAFGVTPGEPATWAADMEAQLDRVPVADAGVDPDAVRAHYRRLPALPDAGPAIRVHGDYHLGQVMRTDTGWYVLDFEGEPARPLEERRRPSSPMRDVAGMLRSFHYATQIALREWGEEVDDEVAGLGEAWERHNAFSFVEGYLAADGIAALLPPDDGARRAVQAAFELDKAIYEVGYEQGYRPDWVDIPLAAVRRILAGHVSGAADDRPMPDQEEER